MTIFYNKIIGLPVVFNENKKAGIIKDIVLNPDKGQLLGFIVSSNKIINKNKYLFVEDIVEFKNNRILIKSEDAIKTDSILRPLQKKHIESNIKIKNCKVITISDDDLGSVSDIEIDASSGKILKIFVSGGIIKKLIRGELIILRNQIIKITENKVLVHDLVVKSDKKVHEKLGGEKKLAGAGLYIKIS